MEFVQTFTVDDELCDFIMEGIQVPPDITEPTAAEAPIEELAEPVTAVCREYFKRIPEYNYFVGIDELEFDMRMWITYIPQWTFMKWTSEEGDLLNFYIFLKDTDSVVEFFNPMAKKTVRFKGTKGLGIVVPAAWLFTRRHTNTFETTAVFVMGLTRINNLNNVHKP